jgi:MFS family permease
MALLCAGSVLAAATTSYPLLLVARVLQGSASAVFPLSMTIVADEWGDARLRAGIGWLSATFSCTFTLTDGAVSSARSIRAGFTEARTVSVVDVLIGSYDTLFLPG